MILQLMNLVKVSQLANGELELESKFPEFWANLCNLRFPVHII